MPGRRGPRHADRFARHDDQPAIERVAIDGDGIEPLADLERDELLLVLEHAPASTLLRLEARPAKHQRPMRGVLEVLLAVDPPAHAEVPVASRIGDFPGLRDGHDRGRGEDASHPNARAQLPHREHPRAERDDAEQQEQEGTHGRMIPTRPSVPIGRRVVDGGTWMACGRVDGGAAELVDNPVDPAVGRAVPSSKPEGAERC